MKFDRVLTAGKIEGRDVAEFIKWKTVDSVVTDASGRVIFEKRDVEVPEQWSENATNILAQKYLRKAGVPSTTVRWNDEIDPKMPSWLYPSRPVAPDVPMGGEHSARQVFHRFAGCWTYWGWRSGLLKDEESARVFYDEAFASLALQYAMPNSPQWFNTGLYWAYGIEGPNSGQWYVDEQEYTPGSADVMTPVPVRIYNSYERPQPHACQPAWALVSTPRGPVRIVDLAPGDDVYDGDGTTKVVARVDSGIKDVIRLTTSTGNYVEVTEDHRVLVSDDRGENWTEARNVSEGMRLVQVNATSVALASYVNTDEAKLAIAEAYLVGFIQGDGYQSRTALSSPCIEIMTVNDDEEDVVARCLDQVFGEDQHRHKREEVRSDRLTIRRTRFYGKNLLPFLDKYEITDDRWAENMRVPGQIMTGGRIAACAYLRGFFQAEGCVRIKGRSGSDYVSSDIVVNSISGDLLRDIQHLLLNLGISSTVKGPYIDSRGDRKPGYSIGITYLSERIKFRELISFVGRDKTDRLDASVLLKGKNLPSRRADRVCGIERIATTAVYDIQTLSGKYLTNNIVVHNCFIQTVHDDLVNEGGIMDLWTREARLFKHGSGTGSNFSSLRGANEPLSAGGKSSGMMSFLKIGDRAAGAIKSGGTTRRAAKMVIVDADHPDVEEFVDWKMVEEHKAAAMAVGSRAIRERLDAVAASPCVPRGSSDAVAAEALAAGVPQALIDRALAGDRDWPVYEANSYEGPAIETVSGQNGNNTVRVTNAFLENVTLDEDHVLRARTTGNATKVIKARDLWRRICHATWASGDPGIQFQNTINEWHTCAADGAINASNPCSEYLFLDDTSCNLASLGLVRFLREDGSIDLALFEHLCRLWTVVLDVSVSMASSPSAAIAMGTYNYRTLGLGYMDLGGLLMRLALPYDSDEGRTLAAGLTALMTGVAYRTSAEMADEVGPFPRWEANAESMRRVLRNHARAACCYDSGSIEFEGVSAQPNFLDDTLLSRVAGPDLYHRIVAAWRYVSREAKSFRNAQVTLLAPTGTISFVADCDTTGVEPDFALVKSKKLAGGGTMQIANRAIPEALRRMGLAEPSVQMICGFVDTCGEMPTELHPRRPIGCPWLKEEDLSVFDCAGDVSVEGHVRMVAAVQPFLSGGVSKTINLPRDATVEDVDRAFRLAARLGVKAVAPYRDGSKLSQPLSAADLKPSASLDLAAMDVQLSGVFEKSNVLKSNIPPMRVVDNEGGTRPLARGEREYLPWRRGKVWKQKVKIGEYGQTVYLDVSEYDDGRPGEVFLEISGQGSTLRALADCLAMAISLGLQYGVPVEKFVDKFVGTKFEPDGYVEGHDRIRFVSSIADYLGRELGIAYAGMDDLANVPAVPAEALDRIAAVAEAADERFRETLDSTRIVAHASHAAAPRPAPRVTVTGDPCPRCGSLLVKNGTCSTCPNCGLDGGCSG